MIYIQQNLYHCGCTKKKIIIISSTLPRLLTGHMNLPFSFLASVSKTRMDSPIKRIFSATRRGMWLGSNTDTPGSPWGSRAHPKSTQKSGINPLSRRRTILVPLINLKNIIVDNMQTTRSASTGPPSCYLHSLHGSSDKVPYINNYYPAKFIWEQLY